MHFYTQSWVKQTTDLKVNNTKSITKTRVSDAITNWHIYHHKATFIQQFNVGVLRCTDKTATEALPSSATDCRSVTNVLITCLEPSMTWPQRSMTTEPIVTVGQAAACNVADKHQQLLPALNSLCDWQPRTTCLHGNASRTRIALQ